MFLTDTPEVDRMLKRLRKLGRTLASYKQRSLAYQSHQRVFKVEVSRFEDLDEAIDDLEDKHTLWRSIKDWETHLVEWDVLQFEDIPADEIAATVAQYVRICARLEQRLPANDVLPRIANSVKAFNEYVPILLDLKNPAIKSGHWQAIAEAVNERMSRSDESLTLGTLLAMDLLEYKDAIAEISLEATNEKALADTLTRVEAIWTELELKTKAHKENEARMDEAYILVNMDEVGEVLDDTMIMVSTVLGSRFLTQAIRMVAEKWDQVGASHVSCASCVLCSL